MHEEANSPKKKKKEGRGYDVKLDQPKVDDYSSSGCWLMVDGRCNCCLDICVNHGYWITQIGEKHGTVHELCKCCSNFTTCKKDGI